jgi:hypothetical protein
MPWSPEEYNRLAKQEKSKSKKIQMTIGGKDIRATLNIVKSFLTIQKKINQRKKSNA